MSFRAFKMKYTQERAEKPSNIELIPFEKRFFDEYKKVYNECFYEMRKDLDRKPYNWLQIFEQIEDDADNIFLLLSENNEIIASVTICFDENEIDGLIVRKDCQRNGYGRQLVRWAVNYIRQHNTQPIFLHVTEWNKHAYQIYLSEGFEVCNTEIVE